jgi:hypothetical protein
MKCLFVFFMYVREKDLTNIDWLFDQELVVPFQRILRSVSSTGLFCQTLSSIFLDYQSLLRVYVTVFSLNRQIQKRFPVS